VKCEDHCGLQELSAELLRGFAECLELEDAEIMKPVEDEFVGEYLNTCQQLMPRVDSYRLIDSLFATTSETHCHFKLRWNAYMPCFFCMDVRTISLWPCYRS